MASDKEIGLQTLLPFPYLWNSKKILEFSHATWKLIDGNYDLKKDLNFKYKKFLCAKRISKWSWVTELETPIWNILKKSWDGKLEQNVNYGKDAWITELLRLIRNKHEHIRDLLNLIKRDFEHQSNYETAIIEIKSWFNEAGELNNTNFVMFWVNKFPLLFPFLWINLYKYRNNKTLENFYWFWIDPLGESLLLDLQMYTNKLNSALAIHLEEGSLKERFRYGVGAETSTIEIREYSDLKTILDGSSIVFIEVKSDGCLIVTHFFSEGSCEILKFSGLQADNKAFNMLFTNDINYLEVWSYFNDSTCDIFVFGEEDNLTEVNHEFIHESFKQVNFDIVLSKYPITWNEISKSKQKQVEERSVVLIQGREILMKKILSNFKNLEGHILNQLLQNKKPELFGKYKLPKPEKVYLERTVSVSGYIQLEVLLKCSPNDIFIVSNINEETFTKLKNNRQFCKINSLEDVDFTVNGKIFLLPEYVECSYKIIEKCMTTDFKGCVHYVYFNNQGISRLVESIFAPLCKDKKAFVRSGPENQFIEEAYRSKIGPLFFVADPGSGKSQLFTSLAEKLRKKRFVIVISMRDFVRKVIDRVGMMRKIFARRDISHILSQFICSNESEKLISDNWFEEKDIHLEHVELMLDGFDELPNAYKKYSNRLLHFIQKEFSRIRLWVASREPPHDGTSEFSYFPCTIEPFDESNQIKYFRVYSESIRGTKLSSKQVKLTNEFARSVLKYIKAWHGMDITAAPLHCRVLAEYYEKNLILDSEEGLDFEILSMSDLYEKLIEKKFDAFLGKKYSIDHKLGKFLIKSYFQLHTYFGLKHFWPGSEENESEFSEPLVMESCENEDYLKMGIITCVHPLTFIHRTFPEHLIARFICQELEKSTDLCSAERFRVLFIDFLTSTDPSLSVSCPATLSFLNEMLESKDCTNLAKKNSYKHTDEREDIISRCLEITFRHNLEKVSWLVLNLWFTDENEGFRSEILRRAVRNGITIEFFVRICELFKYDKNGMNINNCAHFKIFESALRGNYKVGKHLLEMWFEPDQWEGIGHMRGGDGGHIMHIILENYPTFSRENDNDNLNAKRQQKEIIELIKYVNEVDPHRNVEPNLGDSGYISAIERKDGKGRTPLLILPVIDYYGDYIDIRKFLIEELKADVNAVANDNMNALHIIDKMGRKGDLRDAARFYHETVQLFLANGFTQLDCKFGENGQTPLMCALNYFGSQLSEITLKLFSKNGVDFNAQDNNGSTMLHACIPTFPVEFIRKLIDCGSKHFIQSKDGKCALCLCIEHARFDVGEMLLELEVEQECDDDICDKNCKTELETKLQAYLSDD